MKGILKKEMHGVSEICECSSIGSVLPILVSESVQIRLLNHHYFVYYLLINRVDAVLDRIELAAYPRQQHCATVATMAILQLDPKSLGRRQYRQRLLIADRRTGIVRRPPIPSMIWPRSIRHGS